MYFLYLFFACSDSILHKQVIYEPDIIVVPEFLNFDNKSVFLNPHIESLTIVNSGNDVLIGDLISRSEFIEVNESFNIEPNEYIDILVNFNPETEATYNTYIDILSNDPDEGFIEVPVYANGLAPIISVYSDRYNFDDINLGCSEEETLYIENLGSLDLDVTDILQYSSLPEDISSDLNVANNGVLPWVVGPGDYKDIIITYNPSDFQDDESRIIVDSNDPVNPSVEVSHNGTSIQGDIFEDIYVQSGVPSVDILFVIDDSGSMNVFQTELETNISSFLSVFFTTGVDYNLAFITTSSFNPVGQIINGSLQDPLLEAENQVDSIGISGSGIEKGLETSYKALNSPSSLGIGSSFFRESAALSVIYISDEKDHSNNTVSFYVNFLSSLKSLPDMVSAYAIIGDPPNGCRNGSKRADYGDRYYDVAMQLGGSTYSICSPDWGTQMQNLAWTVIYRGNFELSLSNPIESTINVYNNGVLQSDWSYDSSSNSITFGTNSIPEEGDTVKIEYSVYESCEE